MKSKVYIQRCDEYNYEEVKRAVSKIFRDAGGVRELFKADGKILIKPNIISAIKPGKCMTTHPFVVRAVIEELKTATNKIYLGDSPGVGGSGRALRKSGFMDVIKHVGAYVADFDTSVSVSNPEGEVMKRFEIARGCTEYDYFISIPKCKVHPHFFYTGALKNQYGVIPGLRKARGHMQYNTRERFAHMLVDVNVYLKPDFAVMDAVYGIEGDALRKARPRRIGLVLASKDLVALDSITSRIMSLDPTDLPVLKEAYERKVGNLLLEEIEQIGEDHKEFVLSDYMGVKKVGSIEHLSFIPHFLRQKIYNSIIKRPYFDHNKCLRCGNCVEICPSEPRSLKIKRDKVNINYNNCIKCYCCYEVCENGAIYLKSGLLGRWWDGGDG